VLETSGAISAIKVGIELGEFCLMLILQMCTLSLVVLHPSQKLLSLLYPIPGKGSANHLLDLNIDEANHQDALKCVLHHFDLKEVRVFYVKCCLAKRHTMMLFPWAESISNEHCRKTNEKEVLVTNLENT
jgi:hypothetical protein